MGEKVGFRQRSKFSLVDLLTNTTSTSIIAFSIKFCFACLLLVFKRLNAWGVKELRVPGDTNLPVILTN